MDNATRNAFYDEFEKIGAIKESGVMSFLSKGFRNLGNVGKKSLGQHKRSVSKLYQKGAKSGGKWGGVKQVAKSPYGSMGAAAGTAGLAGYGGYKAVTGDGGQRRY